MEVRSMFGDSSVEVPVIYILKKTITKGSKFGFCGANPKTWRGINGTQRIWTPKQMAKKPEWPSVCQHGTLHILLQLANFFVKLSISIVGCSNVEAFPASCWKSKISTLINKCPGFLRNSRQKKLAPRKKGSYPKSTNLQFTPPVQLTWK